jgi:hypothetical protein
MCTEQAEGVGTIQDWMAMEKRFVSDGVDVGNAVASFLEAHADCALTDVVCSLEMN